LQIKKLILGACHTNCYLLEEGGKCLIVDPADQPEAFIEVIEENGWQPQAILLTHAHTDHVLAGAALIERYHIPAAVSVRDAWRLEDEALINSRPYVKEPYRPFKAVIGLGDDSFWRLGDTMLRFFPMPGHTEGSLAILAGEDIILSGDTLLAGKHGRTDLPGGNEEELVASLRRLAALPGDRTVLPGHGPETTLDKERRTNPYLI